MSPRARWSRSQVAALTLTALLLCAATWLLWPARPVAVVPSNTTAQRDDAATIERGRYLAVLGNCMGCHTARGGAAFAGGRGIATPFGTVYSSNLTFDATGLKDWGADDFWRALHHGQSRDGRLLNPAFPYTNTTHVARADSDALFAYLRSLAPVAAIAPPNDLGQYLGSQAALKVWRALYFTPGEALTVAPTDGPLRGAYLVNGLAHCSACHVPRNALGGSSDMLSLAGGLMAAQGWYAPSLLDPAEGGVQAREVAEIVALLQTGRSGTHIVTGPMAEVVQHSTQHWQADDLQAMATHLKALPVSRRTEPAPTDVRPAQALALGESLYEQHCAQCHGASGPTHRWRATARCCTACRPTWCRRCSSVASARARRAARAPSACRPTCWSSASRRLPTCPPMSGPPGATQQPRCRRSTCSSSGHLPAARRRPWRAPATHSERCDTPPGRAE